MCIIKRGFNGKNNIRINFLPNFKSIEGTLKTNVKQAKIDGGVLIIAAKAIKDIFDVCIEKTLDLLTLEYEKTIKETYRVKNVLLVGGFSQSEYLQEKVQIWCKDRGISLTPVTNKMVTSVSYGAVSYGLNPRLVTRRNAGQSYALLLEKSGTKFFEYFIKKTERIETTHKTYTKVIDLNNYKSSVVGKLIYFKHYIEI
jgi:hypothetical protein